MNQHVIGLGYTPRATSTVSQFCDDHNISRTHFYEILKQGLGPRLMKVGRRTLITAEASAAWRSAMEAATEQEAT